MIGQTISHYRVLEKLGEGGMGVVYRAADTRLGRDVALKVLPDLFARDPDRLARFQREAHLLAALNHPHIAAIHGLEEAGGVRCLVLELVEGETLAERLKRGPLPLEEALKISRQIADALEAAHEKGIIHRDLKPANVKLTPAATVKVLDFGLAKAFEGEVTPAEVSKSPTLSAVATQAGILLGTAAYMSPEQAKGRPVDKRGDLWAFGCVLYELLTGKQAFEGETVSDTLASVLKTEPDWKALPADTPAAIRRLLGRCLERDPRRRLQAIGEARILLDDFLAGKLEEGVAAAGVAAAQPIWPWAAAALLAVALGFALWAPWQPRPEPPTPVRLNVALPTTDPLYTEIGPAVVLSPDGRRLAYVTRSGPNNRLYVRELDKLEATLLSGAEGAFNPFFSPDGRWIGFFANGKLKKVSVTGGAPLTLCEAADGRGASWGLDDSIIFSPSTDTPLFKVSAAGGAPEQVTHFDKKKDDVVGELLHRWPQILPGGQAVLFTAAIRQSDYENAYLVAQSLATGERKVIYERGYHGRYLPSGHLVFVHQSTLFAVPFDLERLEMKGAPAPVLEGLLASTGNAGAQFSFSNTGMLVYLTGAQSSAVAGVWANRQGATSPLFEKPGDYYDPRFSPDGKHIALRIGGIATGDIWVYEIARGASTRLSFNPGLDILPLWSPDGQWVAHTSAAGGSVRIVRKRADGAGDEEVLYEVKARTGPIAWSPDGKLLVIVEESPQTSFDIKTLRLDADGPGKHKAEPFLATPFVESRADLSLDGRWLAYQSDESGRFEVYVRPFPGPGGKWQVSTEGGDHPRWSPKGNELFYQAPDGKSLMAVSYFVAGSAFRPEKPRLLFQADFADRGGFYRYDVAPDGQRFLILKRLEGESPVQQPTLVLNWFEELRRQLAPAQR